MPDISMCENKKCKRRKQCYRYTAKPNKYRQSYAKFEEKDCKYFIDNKRIRETIRKIDR